MPQRTGARVLSAAVILALALAVNACAAVPSAPVEVESNEEVAETPSPVEAAEQRHPELLELGWQDFSALDSDEKRAFAFFELFENYNSHLVTITSPKGAPQYYPMVVGDDIPSVDLDGQTIVNNFRYVLEDARSRRTVEKSLDHDMAIKLLSAAFYETNDAEDVTDRFTEVRDELLASATPYYISNGTLTVMSEGAAAEGSDPQGRRVTFKDVTYSDELGQSWQARFYHVEVVGQDEPLWLLATLTLV